MFIYFEAFVIFFFTLYIIKFSNPDPGKFSLLTKIFRMDNQSSLQLAVPVLIILFGVLFRMTLIPAAPSTSPDVYRYIWEGKVLYNGFNPYSNSPDANELKGLRDEVYPKVTFKNIPSIYPPFAQVVFFSSYIISGSSVTGIKIIYLLCEIITMIFLLKLLLRKKIKPELIILYAWLPLPVMEYFVNAHIDVVGIMFLVMFFYFMEKGKPVSSALSFTMAFLVKLYPVFLLPLVFKELKLKKAIQFLTIFVIISALFYLPFLSGRLSVTDALSIYVSRWEFNASVYYVLTAFIHNHELARMICGVCILITAGTITFYYKNFIKASFGILLAVLIFSPVVYPWYLGWIAALNPFALFYSALSLFFTINLSNFSPLGKIWHEYFPVLFIEYMIFFGLLAYDLYYRRLFIKKDNQP